MIAACERAGMKMSIFDRFVSRETGEKERKSVRPTSFKVSFSELDTAVEEAKAQYPGDSKIVDEFCQALRKTC